MADLYPAASYPVVRSRRATVVVEEAISELDFVRARRLLIRYKRHLKVDLEMDDFSGELDRLAEIYGPPQGALLVARSAGNGVGCVALRELNPGLAEVKRMFVLPDYQGNGIGRQLLETLIQLARSRRYRRLYLDTLGSFGTALALYHRFGFRETTPLVKLPFADQIALELRL